MIQQTIQLTCIIKVGVDGFLVRVGLHEYRIIRLRAFLYGNIGTGISKRKYLFLWNSYQLHVLAVHTPQIV